MALTMTDVIVEACHVHEEAEDTIRRHVYEIGVDQLMPKYFLQHRRQLGVAARKTVTESFTAERMVERQFELYQKWLA